MKGFGLQPSTESAGRRVFCLGVLPWMLMLIAGLVQADWVDPDTPLEARTTEPYNAKPPNLHYGGGSHGSSSSKDNTKSPPTTSPAPTESAAPSETPSSSPTMYPTYVPRTFKLVFSDEFNVEGRELRDGGDPRWTALDKNDYTNDALHYYSPNNAQIRNGHLVITSEATDTEIIGFDDQKLKKTRVTKHFRSAMVQSWNKFCFTGGIIEAEVQLPGKPYVGGLWPALWMLGNLARHTYVGSSEHMWPWSSLVCTAKARDAQKLNGCQHIAHYGMHNFLGRGAPEIDIFEAQPGNVRANVGPFLKSSVGQPFASASFQVAPGRPTNRPGPGEWPGPGQWYSGLIGGPNASLNINFYGNYNHFNADSKKSQDYWSDAISYNRQLNASYFNAPHVFRLEWDVPTHNSAGYLHWFLDGELVLAIKGETLIQAGLGSSISSEPSYLLMNTAISKQWGFPLKCPVDCKCKDFDCHSDEWQMQCGFSDGFCDMMTNDTPEYKINWLRVYQDPSNPVHKVGCSTPERPTRRFIEGHAELYKEEKDAVPLLPIQRGGGVCDVSVNGTVAAACGGPTRGRCTKGRLCSCFPNWTGPHCLSHAGVDNIIYDEPDSISDLGFVPPAVVPKFLVVAFAGLTALLIAALVWKRRFDGWTAIPDADPIIRNNVRPAGRGALI
ncbi:hypothetical protein ACA910_021080 [Epithemia clementina (nom. ined.)]